MLVHILIAEDEALITDILQVILEDEGYRVTVAPDGEAAAMANAADPADLLLTDIRMPRRDGLELAAELRGRQPGLPVILMTGSTESKTITLPPGIGPTLVFTKPVHTATLVKVIGALAPSTS